jgi:hypothetical protein
MRKTEIEYLPKNSEKALKILRERYETYPGERKGSPECLKIKEQIERYEKK